MPSNLNTTFPNPSSLPKQIVRSTLVSRNVTISGHRTSVRLEPDMWSGLSEICRRERANIHEVCTSVSIGKEDNTSLTAAIRVFVMAYFRAAATEDGHSKANHGYGIALNMAGMAAHTAPTSQPTPRAAFMIGTSSGMRS